MRHMCLFGKITDSRDRSHVQATIFPCFPKLKNNKKTNLASENPHKHPNEFYTLLNLFKYQQYVNI